MKLLLVLPAIALLVFAFAKKEYVVEESVLAPSNSNSLNINQNTNQLNEDNLIKIEGMVTNLDGTPLTGANVFIKNTNTGTVVDEQGEFELFAPKIGKEFKGRIDKDGKETIENANVIVISYVGYSTLEIAFDSREDRKFENIRLTKSVFNVELPKVINKQFAEYTPPPPPRKPDKIFTMVERQPYYTNGVHKLAMDIQVETELVMKKTIDRGDVLVGFTVDTNGKIINTHIVESSESGILDASAMKIIQKLDKWNPAIQGGKGVPVDLTVPVNFN